MRLVRVMESAVKALVLEENARLVFKDVPPPVKLTENSYLVRVYAAGICGSDIHRGFEGGAYHYPLIMGHEFSGIIEEAPHGARYPGGGRVAVYPLLPCRKCRPCQTGDFAQCVNYNYFGSRCDGAFAEYVYVPEENLFPVPEHVSLLHAAMTEPCAVALHGARKLSISAGETAVVYGAGPIGNAVAQWLRILGCGRVALVDIDERKLGISEEMGFTTINPRKTDPVRSVLELTGGEGAEKVVEACGLPLTYNQALQSAGRHAEVLLLGNISGDLVMAGRDISSLLRKELRIFGTWNSKPVPWGTDDWSTVLRFMDRELSVAPLISHTPPLEEGAETFKKIVDKIEFFNKVIFSIPYY